MASDLDFVEYVRDQVSGAGDVTFRKMFGEYALYCDGKVVAFICDNQLFVKPTAGGREYVGSVTEAPFYPGGKPHFLIEDRLDDREWLTGLIRLAWQETPMPKPKPEKSRKRVK
ncbi:MAG: TfoX family protein [Candidatus Zixiibacteriota bacterium]|nr:MAG: TfoX family protein [candidate division Zixibacteria bacterium]